MSTSEGLHYSPSGREDAHQLLERLERRAEVEVEGHLVDTLQICYVVSSW